MIVEPEQRVPDFIKAGADIVSVHCEHPQWVELFFKAFFGIKKVY